MHDWRLQEDLINANARGARLFARVQQLEEHLSRHLRKAWRESGLGGPADTEELKRTITRPNSALSL
ncbi:hypothetical protein [Streptomyces sp. NPDC057301]|uniref:hypothetical protein n=1 Tax=Streptomyces sp. NPDC057301 TaxID=3346093 RepID=UPI00363DB15C